MLAPASEFQNSAHQVLTAKTANFISNLSTNELTHSCGRCSHESPYYQAKYNGAKVKSREKLSHTTKNTLAVKNEVKNKPGFSLLYGSYSCSKAQTVIFKIRCTALLSKRKSRGPITRLLVDFSWTIPKSSFFPEGKSC